MEALVTIRKEAPNREALLRHARNWLQRAGIPHHTEADRLRLMVTSLEYTVTSIVVIVEPKDAAKVAERIQEGRRAKARANAALVRLHAEAEVFHGKKHAPSHRAVSPAFVVVAREKVPEGKLPRGVLSFALSEEARIIAALREAAKGR